MKRRVISIILCVSLIFTFCIGCSSKNNETEPSVSTKESTQTAQAGAENAVAPGEYSLPLTTKGETLTMFAITNNNVTKQIGDLKNHQVYKKAEEVTGVKVEISSVMQETSETQFSLVIASGEYPDMVRSGKYVNGISAAKEETIIIDLSDQIEKYAPHYAEILKDNPKVAKYAKSDEGKVLAFYMLNANNNEFSVPCLNGPIIRSDLLTKLNMEIPENLDEMHDVLLAFKTNFNLDDPLLVGKKAFEAGFIMGAYDAAAGIYQVDGKVKYGPVEPGFKKYLEMMTTWYKDGILNPDFYNYDDNPMSSVTEGKKTGGAVGVFSAPAANMSAYCNDTVNYVGMSMMPNANGKNHISGDNKVVDTSKGMTITTDCKNVELAVRWCDFWYTDEGRLLSNYGLEGKTFEYGTDGKPHWTELITKNPDGLSLGICRQVFTTLTQQPGVCPKDLEVSLLNKNALSAVELWNASGDSDYNMPNLALTADESTRSAQLLSDITTLGDETWNKILIGDQRMDTFDAYVKQVNSMGIDEVIQIYQTALDRYNNR